jgi:GT2 family glycosyltransferase
MIDVVIIPVLNRYDLLERSILSLGQIETLIVIDNGGGLPDGYLDDIAVRMIGERRYLWRMPSNLGVATSWNLGIKATPHATGWLLLNSDAAFADAAFDIFADDTQAADVVQAGTPPWCCTWISSRAIWLVGLFCERFYPAYMEDVDWERRALTLGVDFVMSAADVIHDNSSTIGSDSELARRNAETHRINADYFAHRWRNVQPGTVPHDVEWELATRIFQGWP